MPQRFSEAVARTTGASAPVATNTFFCCAQASQSAESRNDFIHRMSICLKELRETHVWLELCRRLELVDAGELERAVGETDELIAIFMASIKTARKNGAKRVTKTQ